MDRGAGQAAVHGVAEQGTTEPLSVHTCARLDGSGCAASHALLQPP